MVYMCVMCVCGVCCVLGVCLCLCAHACAFSFNAFANHANISFHVVSMRLNKSKKRHERRNLLNNVMHE